MTRTQREAIEALRRGETIPAYKEGGNSMVPLIYSRQPVRLEPCDPELLEKDDIVLAKAGGNVYTHKVTATRKGQVQIGNNRGHINGWTSYANVFGIVTEVDGRVVSGALRKVKRAE